MKEYERQKNKIQVGGTWCMELVVHIVFFHASSVIINASAWDGWLGFNPGLWSVGKHKFFVVSNKESSLGLVSRMLPLQVKMKKMSKSFMSQQVGEYFGHQCA